MICFFNVNCAVKQSEKGHEEAIQDFTEALKLNPEYIDAFYNRGLSYTDWVSMKKQLRISMKR